MLRKAADVVVKWKNLHLGFFYNMIACNVYILPLFSYVGQLVRCSEDVSKFLSWMKDQLFSGPGNWVHLEILTNFKRLGFPIEVRDLKEGMYASQVRVAANTEEDIETLHAEVGRQIISHRNSECGDVKFATWHSHCFVNNIVLAKRGFDLDVVGQSEVHLGRCKQPGGCKVQQKLIQKRICAGSSIPKAVAFQARMRKRIDRWNTSLPKAHAHERAMRRLRALQGRVKPASFVAYFKALMNAWPTARRMRKLANNNNVDCCPFCEKGKDSIEHFARCKYCINIFRKHGVCGDSITSFLALDDAAKDVKCLTIKVRIIAAIFKVKCVVAVHPRNTPKPDVDALFLAEGL